MVLHVFLQWVHMVAKGRSQRRHAHANTDKPLHTDPPSAVRSPPESLAPSSSGPGFSFLAAVSIAPFPHGKSSLQDHRTCMTPAVQTMEAAPAFGISQRLSK